MNITTKKKINIFMIGFVASLMFLLMFYVLFAQILSDFVIGNVEDNSVLFAIILGLLLITFFVSIIVGGMIIKGIKQTSIIKASIMSILLTLFIIIIISYIGLFVLFPQVFRELQDIEIILIFPQVIVYFGIYVLGQVYALFILTLIIYFLLFVSFLDVFYQYAPKKYVSKKTYKW